MSREKHCSNWCQKHSSWGISCSYPQDMLGAKKPPKKTKKKKKKKNTHKKKHNILSPQYGAMNNDPVTWFSGEVRKLLEWF